MISDKNIDYTTNKVAPVADDKLLSPQEWFDLKNKVEWGTANYAERNKYNMIVKHLNKDK